MNPLLCVYSLTLPIVKQANAHKELGHNEQKSLPSTARSSKRLLVVVVVVVSESRDSPVGIANGLRFGSMIQCSLV